MKQCWPEGALRAYLDGELSPEDRQSVTAHLEECGVCERLHKELAARAERVSDWLGALDGAVIAMPRRQTAARAGLSWRWTAAAVAVAAGLAIATVLVPKQEAVKPPVAQVVAPEPPVPTPAVRNVQPAAVVEPSRPVVAASRRQSRPSHGEPFVALDDEPIESGIVVRVTVPGSSPADIVFSPDGRARAVRLVSGTQRSY